MSEGVGMALLILFVFLVMLPAFVFIQIRRENKKYEEDMVYQKKDKKAQQEDKDTRNF